jgi:hypothetical protein
MPKKTIVVEVEDRNPFGENVDESIVDNPIRSLTYVPGYSDAKHKRELDIKEGKTPRPLRHRFQWVRAERATGSPDGTKINEFKGKGYHMIGWQEAIDLGYNMEESAAVKGEDGTCRLGDQVLMVCDAKTAATHYKRWRETTDSEYDTRVGNPMKARMEEYNRAQGHTTATGTDFEHEVEPQGKKFKRG